MNLREILAVLARRWYVTLLALSLAGWAWSAWAADGGSYSTSTVVLFTLPARASLLPESGLDDSNVIAFAGVVAQEINGGRPAPHYASHDAPLYGVGVRNGVLVGLPDSGTQWTSSYSQAEIEIQIVARSREEVRSKQLVLIDQVLQITHDQQQSSSPGQRITASVMPLTTSILHLTSTRSSQVAALLALIVAAVLAGGATAVHLDRWSRQRAARKDTLATPAGPTPEDRHES